MKGLIVPTYFREGRCAWIREIDNLLLKPGEIQNVVATSLKTFVDLANSSTVYLPSRTQPYFIGLFGVLLSDT